MLRGTRVLRGSRVLAGRLVVTCAGAHVEPDRERTSGRETQLPRGDMSELTGKHGLIVGIANKRSIAWAIAKAAAAAGARLAVTYQGERLEENVRELASELIEPVILPCDVTNDAQIAEVMASVEREFGGRRNAGASPGPHGQGNRARPAQGERQGPPQHRRRGGKKRTK